MRSAFFLSLLLLPGMASAQPPQKPAPKSAPKPKAVESEADLLAQLKKADSAEAAKPIEEKLALLYRASGLPNRPEHRTVHLLLRSVGSRS